jgi:hypothetical protein
MNRSVPLPPTTTSRELRRGRRSPKPFAILTTAAIAAVCLAPAPASAASTATPPDESSFPVTRSGHAPGFATGGHCQLSVAASPPRITVGETVTLTGTLSCAEVASAAGEPVTILQRQREVGGPSILSEVATATTGPDGAYQFTSAGVDANSVFVVRSPGARSAHIAVKVLAAVTIQGPTPGAVLFTRGNAGAHNRLTFTGTVSPGEEGAQVALQREYLASGEQWRTIALARVGADGGYSVTHGFRIPGEVSVRVVVHPKGPNLAVASEALSYTVAQTQNPRLTIQTSADPLSFGQSATITGIVAGAGGQAVTLFARTPGHPFVAVGKDTTGAGGEYSFTVSPVQSTYYRVLSATTISSQLFEGFRYALTSSPVPATVEEGSQLTFSGTVLPAPAGQPVRLEQQNISGIGFHVIAEATTNGESAYAIVATFTGLAQRVLRVRVPANSQSVGTASELFTLGVTPSSSGAPEAN